MEITANELKALLGEAGQPITATLETSDQTGPWQIGKPYLIRTVTQTLTGCLCAVHEHELVLTDAAWIGDTERWATAVADGAFREVEPFPDGTPVIVGRGAIIDAVAVTWPLPRMQK